MSPTTGTIDINGRLVEGEILQFQDQSERVVGREKKKALEKTLIVKNHQGGREYAVLPARGHQQVQQQPD